MSMRRFRSQSGTLYEIPVLGTILILAGAMLVPIHRGFWILTILGLATLFAPILMGFVHNIRLSRQIDRCIEELRAQGFSPDIVQRGNRRANAVALDGKAGRIALIEDYESPQLMARQDLQEVVLSAVEVTRLGANKPRTWYEIKISGAGKAMILDYSRRWAARRSLARLQAVLGDEVSFRDETRR